MSSNGQACDVSCPMPYANAWSQPCVTSCGDSRAVVYPPPVAIVFPGPALSSCPQESFVGTSAPMEIGSSFGYGCSLDAQSSFGSGAYLGGRYCYPCYSRNCGIHRPAKPCKVFLDGKTQKKQVQIHNLNDRTNMAFREAARVLRSQACSSILRNKPRHCISHLY